MGDRLNEALVTLLGAKGDTLASALIGLGVVGAVVIAARAERRGERGVAMAVLALAALPYVAGALTDLSFVPGMLVAFPLAIGALLVPPRGKAQLVVVMAVGALPLVWAFQYLGGAGPQWGGRYILTSGVLLGVVATVRLRDDLPVVARGLTVLSIGVAALSVVWLGVRSRSVERLFDDLVAVDADVMVSRGAFLLREGGAATTGQRWLSVDSETTFKTAIDVAERSGASTLAVVEYGTEDVPDAAIPDGWTVVERRTFDLTGSPVGVVVLERSPP